MRPPRHVQCGFSLYGYIFVHARRCSRKVSKGRCTQPEQSRYPSSHRCIKGITEQRERLIRTTLCNDPLKLKIYTCGAPCVIKRVGPNTSAPDAAGLKSAADDKGKNADNMTNNEANISRRARFAHQSFVSDHWRASTKRDKRFGIFNFTSVCLA